MINIKNKNKTNSVNKEFNNQRSMNISKRNSNYSQMSINDNKRNNNKITSLNESSKNIYKNSLNTKATNDKYASVIKGNGFLENIENKLKELELEKEELENKYGLNEDIIKESLNYYLNKEIKLKKPSEFKKYENNIKEINEDLLQIENNDLNNKIKKINFQSSESYKESLKYEPCLYELKDEETFNYRKESISFSQPLIDNYENDSNMCLNDYLDYKEEQYIKFNINI